MGRSAAAKKSPRDSASKVAQQRLSVLELAKELGNVADTCRQRGMAPSEFRHREPDLVALCNHQTVFHLIRPSAAFGRLGDHVDPANHDSIATVKTSRISACIIHLPISRAGRQILRSSHQQTDGARTALTSNRKARAVFRVFRSSKRHRVKTPDLRPVPGFGHRG